MRQDLLRKFVMLALVVVAGVSVSEARAQDASTAVDTGVTTADTAASCTPDGVEAIANWSASGTTLAGDLTVTNAGDAACSLSGFPSISILDSSGNALTISAGSSLNDGNGAPTLQPGDDATAPFVWRNWCANAPAGPLTLAVTLSGATTAVPTAIQDLASDTPGCDTQSSPSTLSVGGFGDGGGTPTPTPTPTPSPTGSASVLEDLNLRSGPSTSNNVLLVMPAGAVVELTGESQSNFLGVTYQGSTGWAFADFLDTTGGGSTGGDTATTTDALNLRSGPNTDSPVLLVMPSGATVTLRGGSESNFLAVTYNGTNGWAFADFLNTTGGGGGGTGSGVAVTTDSLNLRAGPSASDTVLDVMPSGSDVTLNGVERNDYVSVTFNGVDGWAAASFIDATGGDLSGEATTIAAVNLRSSAAIDNNVVQPLAEGATVTLTGDAASGFVSVSVGGVTGWVYAAYLAR